MHGPGGSAAAPSVWERGTFNVLTAAEEVVCLLPPACTPPPSLFAGVSTAGCRWEFQNATFPFVVLNECAFLEFTTRGDQLLACFPGGNQLDTWMRSKMKFPPVTGRVVGGALPAGFVRQQ